MGKWLVRGAKGLAILAVVLAAGAVWKREQITRLLAVNSLFAPEKIVQNFSNMDQLFLTRVLPRGDGPISSLPAGAPMVLPAGAQEWISARNVTALVVVQNAAVRHESYYLGTGPDDLRISWSMAKSVLSALLGLVVQDGDIASLDDGVTQYAPELKGSAYDGASIRHVLNMASGVTFNEDYLDFYSDINKMGRVLALGGSMDDFAAGLDARDAAPGLRWQYVSIDTHVLGMVIAGATGRDVGDLMAERIVAPMGLEFAPYFLTDGYDTPFVLGGLNMRTRDYARFGVMVAQGGLWNGTQIVPADWIAASIAPSAPTAAGQEGYGYQWWIPQGAKKGEVMARGIYGQYIWIDTQSGVVIAVNAADRLFEEAGVDAQNVAMFRAIAAAL